MDVSHIILGRLWLYDMDVTMYGYSNTCTFVFKGKNIKLVSLPSKVNPEVKGKVDKGKSVKDIKTKAPHIINSKEFEREVKDKTIIFALVTKGASPESTIEHSPEVEPIFREFRDMFPDDLSDKLPHMRDVQHIIDLVLGEAL